MSCCAAWMRSTARMSDGVAGTEATGKPGAGAMAAAGPGLQDVAWRVVCAGEGLPAAEKALGWPVRCGRVVLLLALDRVAGYYGLP